MPAQKQSACSREGGPGIDECQGSGRGRSLEQRLLDLEERLALGLGRDVEEQARHQPDEQREEEEGRRVAEVPGLDDHQVELGAHRGEHAPVHRDDADAQRLHLRREELRDEDALDDEQAAVEGEDQQEDGRQRQPGPAGELQRRTLLEAEAEPDDQVAERPAAPALHEEARQRHREQLHQPVGDAGRVLGDESRAQVPEHQLAVHEHRRVAAEVVRQGEEPDDEDGAPAGPAASRPRFSMATVRALARPRSSRRPARGPRRSAPRTGPVAERRL